MGKRRKGKLPIARGPNAVIVTAMRRRKTRQAADSTHSWSVLRHPFEPQSIFSQDRVEAIHQAALDVLQNLGIKVLLPEAIELFAKHGAAVSGDMLRIGSDMVEAALASAPQSFTLHAPNPARNLPVAPGQLIFTPGGGCPNVSDAIRGRRPGDLASYQDAVRLMQSFDVIHKLTPAPEPQDIPVHLRHYAMMQTQMGLGDKAVTVYGRGRQQVQECFEIIQTALGLSAAEFSDAPYCSTVINTNSPRMLDRPMAQALIDFARAGQMCIVTPFCLAGCYGADHDRRGFDLATCRGFGGHYAQSTGQTGRSGDVRRLWLERGYEIGSAEFWHAGTYSNVDRLGANGPSHRPALAFSRRGGRQHQ